MSKGIIKWFNNEKGYGFINADEQEDIFVHYSSINIDGYKTLNEGDNVEFKLIKTDKGYTIIPIFHPNYLILKPSAKRDVWNALQNVQKMLKNA